jgi:hypothetical protein
MLKNIASRRHILGLGIALASGTAAVQAQTPPPPDTAVRKGSALQFATQGNVVRGFSPYVQGGPFGNELPSVVGAPFSAVGNTQNVTTLLDGNRIVQTTSVRYYRDSQGRTRLERSFPMRAMAGFPAPPLMVNVYDAVTGQHFMLQPQNKTVSEFPAMSASGPVLQAPVKAPPIFPNVSMPGGLYGFGFSSAQSDTQKSTELGEKSIDGIRVVGSRVEFTIPTNSIGNQKPIKLLAEQWFSPDLGVVIQSSQRSTAGMETSYRLEQINREEPDRSLFVVPADYTKQEEGSRGFTTFRLEPIPATPAPPE